MKRPPALTLPTLLVLISLALPALCQPLDPGGGTLRMRVRDSRTGRSLAASLKAFATSEKPPFAVNARTLEHLLGAHPQPELAGSLASDRATAVALSQGTHVLELQAAGHRPLATYFEVTGGEARDVTVWLDPLTLPPELRPEAIQAALRPGYALLHGHVSDAATGRPVPDAQVYVRQRGVATATDENGYFRLYVPIVEPLPDALPETDDLVVELPGYKTYVVSDILLPAGDTHFLVDLEHGSGTTGRNDRHELLRHADRVAAARARRGEVGGQVPAMGSAIPWSAGVPVPSGAVGTPDGLNQLSAGATTFIDPPNSIRVGYGSSTGATCCTGSCPYTSVFSLEEYVRRGLGDEWISSWGQQSLRSGAIPYRSYGAWYALHPARSTYDICSNACCQVNDSDTASSTTTARSYTAGILLAVSGAVMRSEYSAENNSWNDPNDGLACTNGDLSCGDGYVGSPAAGWPCLFDQVAAGHGCFGHGRGESQWGTSRWDSTYGRKWGWIVDHYYNANGSPSGSRSGFMTSPIRITSGSPSPSSVSAGQSFTIFVGASNVAGLSHSQVMIGASLYSSATGYVSDPAHDTKVTVVSGSSTVSRTFTVPFGTSARTYDLVVALWLDVDQNNAINSGDLVLSVTTLAGAVTVH